MRNFKDEGYWRILIISVGISRVCFDLYAVQRKTAIYEFTSVTSQASLTVWIFGSAKKSQHFLEMKLHSILLALIELAIDILWFEQNPWNRHEWYSLPDIEFEDIMPASFWKFLIRNIGLLSHKDGAVQKFNSNFHNKQ